jgi:hypothetical protein
MLPVFPRQLRLYKETVANAVASVRMKKIVQKTFSKLKISLLTPGLSLPAPGLSLSFPEMSHSFLHPGTGHVKLRRTQVSLGIPFPLSSLVRAKI